MTKKVPRRPPRRPHRPPRPDTPKIPRPRPKPFRPRPKRPRTDELALYLAANPQIANAIKWTPPNSPARQTYPVWSATQKAQLAAVYSKIRKGRAPGLSATPATTYLSSGVWEGLTAGVGLGVDEPTAWNCFLAYVAQSLVVEIAGLVPWSLKNYSSAQLNQLLTPTGLYEYNQTANAFLLSDGATPGDPVRIYRFLATGSFISRNRRDTIGQLLDWCRGNMRHFIGYLDPAVAQATWQYNGYPPVERVISGTTHPQYGFAHWTGGCWGTSSFLANVLRTVNIPVRKIAAGSHATPHFMSEDLYLSHGDDPYDGLLTTTPPIPIDELFIDQNTFTSWLDPNLPQQTKDDNVGRRCVDLAITYLTDWVLKLRCDDLRQGALNPAMSSVYNDSSLKLKTFYTVADLQAMNLWSRIDAKIQAQGPCANLFPGTITAAITSPGAGATVSGVVTVNMSVSGQTTPVNTFKLEYHGNPLLNHTITSLTDSYLWDSVDWANGVATLVLTVTNSAGSTATASVMVTIANAITAEISSPAAGGSVTGTVAVNMAVSGNTIPLNGFSLKIDGNQVLTRTVAGTNATYSWDTTTVANGPHTLALTIVDAVSKTAATSISVDVTN